PVEARKQPRIGGERHAPRLARLELDALEAEQTHTPVAGRIRQIELRNVGALALAGVLHCEARGDRLTSFELQVVVIEGRIAQAVTERVQRPLVLQREPAITHLRALVVLDRDRAAPRRAKPRQLGPRGLVELAGKVIGRRPAGLTVPARTSAIACPPAWPEYHACTIALTLSRHGIDTGLPVSSTTIVFALALATASITASCPHGSDRSGMSKPSPSTRMPNAITTSQRFAVNAASSSQTAPDETSVAPLSEMA